MSIPEMHKHYLKANWRPAVDVAFLPTEMQDVLKKYGSWLEALMRGAIAPYTEPQQQFVKVCEGKRRPETLFERSWFLYRVECIYQDALKMERQAGIVAYKEIRAQFERLARMGHSGASDWLKREGPWKNEPSEPQKGYASQTVWNNPFPLVWQVSGSFGSKYESGQGPVDA